MSQHKEAKANDIYAGIVVKPEPISYHNDPMMFDHLTSTTDIPTPKSLDSIWDFFEGDGFKFVPIKHESYLGNNTEMTTSTTNNTEMAPTIPTCIPNNRIPDINTYTADSDDVDRSSNLSGDRGSGNDQCDLSSQSSTSLDDEVDVVAHSSTATAPNSASIPWSMDIVPSCLTDMESETTLVDNFGEISTLWGDSAAHPFTPNHHSTSMTPPLSALTLSSPLLVERSGSGSLRSKSAKRKLKLDEGLAISLLINRADSDDDTSSSESDLESTPTTPTTNNHNNNNNNNHKHNATVSTTPTPITIPTTILPKKKRRSSCDNDCDVKSLTKPTTFVSTTKKTSTYSKVGKTKGKSNTNTSAKGKATPIFNNPTKTLSKKLSVKPTTPSPSLITTMSPAVDRDLNVKMQDFFDSVLVHCGMGKATKALIIGSTTTITGTSNMKSIGASMSSSQRRRIPYAALSMKSTQLKKTSKTNLK